MVTLYKKSADNKRYRTCVLIILIIISKILVKKNNENKLNHTQRPHIFKSNNNQPKQSCLELRRNNINMNSVKHMAQHG